MGLEFRVWVLGFRVQGLGSTKALRTLLFGKAFRKRFFAILRRKESDFNLVSGFRVWFSCSWGLGSRALGRVSMLTFASPVVRFIWDNISPISKRPQALRLILRRTLPVSPLYPTAQP